MNADRAPWFPRVSRALRKTRVDYRRIFWRSFFREKVTVTSRTYTSASPIAIAAAVIAMEASWANAALASQGPGGGMGTASHLTQVAMAFLVYGASALVVGIGLIGAARRQRQNDV